MTRNGHHVIQKRDLLAMLDKLPESEYVAVEIDGLPEAEDFELPRMPEAPADLDLLKEDLGRIGTTPTAARYIEALEDRVRELEGAWPDRDSLEDARMRASNNIPDVLTIDGVRRNGNGHCTHLLCGI